MKLGKIKSIQVFTDGTICFSQKGLQEIKQVTFYEKDARNSRFSKRIKKNQSFQSFKQNFYKLKYKL